MSTYEQDFTGKNRDRGTLMPMAESKCCMKSAKCWDILINVASHLNSGTDGSFKLDNGLASISNLVVDNDFKTERILVHDPLDGSQITPNVVGVDYSGLAFNLIHRMSPTDLEFSSAAELIKVILGNLRNLEQPRLAIVVNDGTTLDVGLGLVSDFHNVFGLSVNHGLEDVEIDDSTKIVDVGDEDVLLACSNELVKKARVAGEDINHNPCKPVPENSRQSIKDVTMSGRVPVALITGRFLRARKQRFLVNTRVSRLIKSEDIDVVVLVFLNDPSCVFIGVERVHEDEGHIHIVLFVQMLCDSCSLLTASLKQKTSYILQFVGQKDRGKSCYP